MKIVDLSDQIFRSLASPDDINIPSIAAFLRFNTNLGKLNNLLGTDFSINDTTLEIVDSSGVEIDSNAASVYEIIYSLNYLDRQIRRNLGAGSVDVNILQEATSDNGTLRFLSRNSVAQSYIQMKKDLQVQLNSLVNKYCYRAARPVSVDGDDLSIVSQSSRYAPNSIDGSIFIDNAR